MIIVKVSYRLLPGKRDELLSFVADNVENSRKETGNVYYEHFKSIEDEDVMHVVEIWEDMKYLDAHLDQPHYVKFAERRYPILDSYESSVWEIDHLIRTRKGAPRFDTTITEAK